jgi:cellulose synthase/poly-beta-1,6-N-acetylglucosamine synthase-like glycosyltransferase
VTQALADGRVHGERALPTATVVICAYTLDRWELLKRSVASAQEQTVPPVEIILSIDHNEDLFARARQEWPAGHSAPVPVTVVANRYGGRLGSARTTAAEIARGDVLAFLDDDARAETDWLARLLEPYLDPNVVAVGGAPVPEYEVPRPRWFPFEFDWVFGCVYRGLPETRGVTPRLIGASMSVRREALLEIGGFHSDNHDDMDMCHRLRLRWPARHVVFEPASVVRHHVPAQRLTWTYFWRRCFFVNKGKVAAHRNIEGAGNLHADRAFARRTLTDGLAREMRELRRGDVSALARIVAMEVGVALAAAGYALGTVQHWRGSRHR